jgi:hypothetical protein
MISSCAKIAVPTLAAFHLREKVLLALCQFWRNICHFLLRHRCAEGLVLYSGSWITGDSDRQQTP